MTYSHITKKRWHKLTKTAVLRDRTPYDVILEPIVSEKTVGDNALPNKYYFKVHKHANKNDVKEAVQYIYGVTPLSINTMIYAPKWRAHRNLVRKAYKKAIVTLKEWDSIDIVS